ncbi:hypothetical protein V501_00669 [Pseudogymnoascus sp. VKM F-4519 (FW-2642)]|nr:hypothetical protein V501_00669 [Pseudogymnoascus sp. VKM F-4519 (FW-2642)]
MASHGQDALAAKPRGGRPRQYTAEESRARELEKQKLKRRQQRESRDSKASHNEVKALQFIPYHPPPSKPTSHPLIPTVKDEQSKTPPSTSPQQPDASSTKPSFPPFPHLRDQHADIKSKARNALVAEYSGLEYGWVSDADFCHGPTNPIPAIDGLTVHNGFACSDCESPIAGCFLTSSWKSLQVHRNQKHNRKTTKSSSGWSNVKLQTFFSRPKSAIHYFCVTVTEDEAKEITDKRGRPQCQLIDDIKEQWAHEKEQQENMQKVLADGASRHETTNCLKRAGWTAHFKERDLSEIHACSRMPGREDDYLRRMAAAMDRLFFGRCIDGLKSMPLMTRLLLASPHQLDAHSRPFGPLQEKTSMDRNLIYWTRFLCYCLNVLHLEDAELFEKHGFHFAARQRESLGKLWEHLQNVEWSEEALEEELLEVSASFWMQRLQGDPVIRLPMRRNHGRSTGGIERDNESTYQLTLELLWPSYTADPCVSAQVLPEDSADNWEISP